MLYLKESRDKYSSMWYLIKYDGKTEGVLSSKISDLDKLSQDSTRYKDGEHRIKNG